MQIAVAAADEAGTAALDEQVPMALQRVARARYQCLRPIPWEELGALAKSLLVL